MKLLTPPVQSYCLFLAMILYGCFSSPTPDIIGLPEIVVGICLCLSLRITVEKRGDTFPFLLLLGYGLTIPTGLALINGHSLVDMMRDMIPFFYLILPVFLVWIGGFYAERFIAVLAGVGLLFSARTVLAYQPILLTPSLWGQGPPADLLYLANSPEVLFSALYCIGQGGLWLMTGKRLKGIALALLALLPIVAMALMTQRAGMGAVAAYILAGICAALYVRPRWGFIFAGFILIVIGAVWPVLKPVFALLWQKTEIVGLNARAEEWSAVIHILSGGWSTLLFGEGWGGRLENPAVGGLNVNYTHSLISSLLLKTGVIGTLGVLGVCGIAVCRSFKTILSQRTPQDLMIIGAVLFPLLISTFLYASYKSLGFGLILLVFFIFPIRKLEKIQ